MTEEQRRRLEDKVKNDQLMLLVVDAILIASTIVSVIFLAGVLMATCG